MPLLRGLMARLRTRRRFRFEGLSVEVFPGVLNPTTFDASFYFARHALAHVPEPGADVLELGCGCGLASLHLANAGHRVVALDIDPLAVANTAHNCERNDVSMLVQESDWDAVLGDRLFQYIICNPPFLPGRTPVLARALYGGARLEVVQAACVAMARHLCPGGRGLLMTSSHGARERVCEIVQTSGLKIDTTHTIPKWNELYFLDLLGLA